MDSGLSYELLGVACGMIVGMSLGLTGGGGSIFAVPLLTYGLGVPVGTALGLSLASVGATAGFGAALRLRAREIELQAGVIFSLVGMVMAPIGAMIGHRIAPAILLSAFAVMMGYVGMRMWRQRTDGPARPVGVAATSGLSARRALQAAYLGFFVDMFDVYLPIAVLAPALPYFIPSVLSGAAQATIFYVVFAVTLIGRPLGAVVFGHVADRLGRRRTTLVSVAGFGVVTLLIAALPGYDAWGAGAILVLVVLLNGIFIGGEYTAANPLAMEYPPKEKRGLYAALIHIGYPAALVCISLLAALMLKVAVGGGAGSAYAIWGWRIPFVIGALLAGALFIYYYRLVPESELWRSANKATTPLKELFSGRSLRRTRSAFRGNDRSVAHAQRDRGRTSRGD
jgi:uncharacterized membrane protein YfcA